MLQKKTDLPKKQIQWAWISGIAFLLSFGVASVLVIFGKRLDDLGIMKNAYYLLLIPLGFSCAAFLAGAMKSYASFKSGTTVSYGELSLKGPAAIFALVVIGGFVLPNLGQPELFDIIIRLNNIEQPTHKFNDGEVTLFLGKEAKHERIHGGLVTFSNIPIAFNNKFIKLALALENYQLSDTDTIRLLDKSPYVDINIKKTPQSQITEMRGTVVYNDGRNAVGAFVSFNSGIATCYTNEHGEFSVIVPLPEGTKVSIRVAIAGRVKYDDEITLSNTVPAPVVLN